MNKVFIKAFLVNIKIKIIKNMKAKINLTQINFIKDIIFVTRINMNITKSLSIPMKQAL